MPTFPPLAAHENHPDPHGPAKYIRGSGTIRFWYGEVAPTIDDDDPDAAHNLSTDEMHIWIRVREVVPQ